MSKNITLQRYIYKINSSRIINADYDLTLTLEEARENEELIGLSESQLMRRIDQINGLSNVSQDIYDTKMQLKRLKKIKDITYSKPLIKAAYKHLDELIFKSDIIDVYIEKPKDYEQIYEHGFKLNGEEYCRLVGTPNGVKHNTIIFIKKSLHSQIDAFINNGRNPEKKFNPAKLEAYKALVCSSSTPVSSPNGVLVVHDCITHFKDTYIKLDDTLSNDPIETLEENADVEINITDGCGMAEPSLMERWGYELGENYLLPGCVIRNSFCKGAVFPIDYKKFCADRGIEQVQDVWGEWHNINNIELILTESMLKLWDSYSSITDYLTNCEQNGYTFAITKNAVNQLENQRVSNYQFIQSYDFTDEDIDELIAPTVNEIKDIRTNDYRKTILYTSGVGLNDKNTNYLEPTFSSALMIDKDVINDPFVQSQLTSMINKRINRAKIAVLNMQGNYSLLGGDLFALCQNMIGETPTGLLGAGECYCQYWIDKSIDKIAVFRAPMTSHNNIRVLNIKNTPEIREFYKYVNTPTIINAWDMTSPALNGADFDGDHVINTSNDVLIRNTKNLPAIMCIQRAASKCIPTEDILMKSNIMSFGNAVGQVTNKATAMFEIQAGFPKDSEEYKILDYRIRCGQLFQQNAIDKTKGIDAKPMPNEWCNWMANKVGEDDDEETIEHKEFNKRIVSDRKPYFMQYIYPREMAKYNDYIKKNDIKCKYQFRMPIAELEKIKDKTKEQETFLNYYYRKMPLGINPCTINRICWKIESLFPKNEKTVATQFDYSIYKSNAEYDSKTYKKIQKIYKEYQKCLVEYRQKIWDDRIRDDEKQMTYYRMKDGFQRQCYEICPDEKMLCNIILDMCYSKSNNSKQFAWDICGDVIIQNMLEKHNYTFYYPTIDENGDIEFGGDKFKMVEKQLEVKTDDCYE